MKTNSTVRSLLLAALMGTTGIAFAQINVNISLAPPAPQHETMPVMQPGYVWAPGYWAWSGERHVWVRGRPIVQRTGYRWEPDRWEQRGNGYYRHEGRWEHDEGFKPAKLKKAKKEKGEDEDNGRHGGKGGKHEG